MAPPALQPQPPREAAATRAAEARPRRRTSHGSAQSAPAQPTPCWRRSRRRLCAAAAAAPRAEAAAGNPRRSRRRQWSRRPPGGMCLGCGARRSVQRHRGRQAATSSSSSISKPSTVKHRDATNGSSSVENLRLQRCRSCSQVSGTTSSLPPVREPFLRRRTRCAITGFR